MDMPPTAEEVKVSPSGVTAAVAPLTSTPFNIRLIPEYNGMADVVEWVTRAEILCQLQGVTLESVLPLHLTGAGFTVWLQLPTPSHY